MFASPDPAHQTNPKPYPDDAVAFGDALEEIMADGTHDLAAIVAGLNARKVSAGGRSTWTEAALRDYLSELANA